MLSQLGRPEDGTDPTLPNNLEVFVKLQAAERVARGTTVARRPRAGDGEEPQGDPRPRVQLLAADPRQRHREHLRPVRPDRAQDLRRRPRHAAEAPPRRPRTRSRRCPASPTSASSRRARCRRSRCGSIATRSRATTSISQDVQDYIETALAGHVAIGALGRREAVRRHRAPAAGDARGRRRDPQPDAAAQGRRADARVGASPTCAWARGAPRSRARTASATSASA